MNQTTARPAEFYDREWATTWHDMKVFSPVARHTRRLIKNRLDRISYASLLDIGCGGELLKELSLSPEIALSGIDFSSTAIQQVSAAIEGRFEVVDIQTETPPFCADAGVCSEVLEHLDDDETALKNISEAVEYLVVTVPSGPLTDASLTMGHVRHYTRESLRSKLESSGFDVLDIRAWGTPFHDPLYAWLRSRSPQGTTTGTYGRGRRLISSALYTLFHLNIFDHGHKLVALARTSGNRTQCLVGSGPAPTPKQSPAGPGPFHR